MPKTQQPARARATIGSPRHDAAASGWKSKPSPKRRATLVIDSLAAGGEGVGRCDGAVVFVARTAPGERIEAEIDLGPRPARGRVLRILEPSPARVAMPCPHAITCGGCDWMHLAASAQEEGHRAIVRAAILHATGLAELPPVVSHPAPLALGYRTRARLFAQAKRGRVAVGYRAAGSHALVAVDACLVLDPVLAPLVGELGQVLAGSTGEGEALVARGRSGLPVVDLAWDGVLADRTWAALDEKVRQGRWAGARVTLRGVAAPAVFGDPHSQVPGADDRPLVVAPAAFAQPSDAGAVLLARRVAALCVREGRPPSHVVELFAGSGTLSIVLAAGAASFVAVELDAQAAACARKNLADRGLAGKVVTGDADAFPIPGRTSVVVLDPPRAGAPGAARAIAASRAEVVVYVACDPPTLARDLAVLTSGGYGIDALETVELFPQTSHVETLVRLVRRGR